MINLYLIYYIYPPTLQFIDKLYPLKILSLLKNWIKLYGLRLSKKLKTPKSKLRIKNMKKHSKEGLNSSKPSQILVYCYSTSNSLEKSKIRSIS